MSVMSVGLATSLSALFAACRRMRGASAGKQVLLWLSREISKSMHIKNDASNYKVNIHRHCEVNSNFVGIVVLLLQSDGCELWRMVAVLGTLLMCIFSLASFTSYYKCSAYTKLYLDEYKKSFPNKVSEMSAEQSTVRQKVVCPACATLNVG
jgi:hypothetical protein